VVFLFCHVFVKPYFQYNIFYEAIVLSVNECIVHLKKLRIMETVLIILTGFVGTIAATVYGLKFYFNRTRHLSFANASTNESVLIKKLPEADILQHSGLFLRIGFVLSLLLVIIIMSLTFYLTPQKIILKDPFAETIEVFDVPVTYRDETKKETPPPVAAKPIEPSTKIILIDNDTKTKSDHDIKPNEIDEHSTIDNHMNAVVSVPVEKIDEPDVPKTWAEVMPKFPGGEDALRDYLLKCPYPKFAVENEIEGTVFVEFIIDKEGNVTDSRVVRSSDKILAEAALKHITVMPKWEPGKQNGRAVRVKMVSKLSFKMRRY
jgi:periplasmic protein TonB